MDQNNTQANSQAAPVATTAFALATDMQQDRNQYWDKDALMNELQQKQLEEEKQKPNLSPTDKLTDDVERELLFHIIWNMHESKLSPEEGARLAEEFLAILPAKDKEELLEKLNILSQKYKEAQSVYLKYADEQNKEKRDDALRLMSEHIQNGNLEEAIRVAKGATAQS